LIKSFGEDVGQVRNVAKLGLLMLMQVMSNNAKTPQGVTSLAKAMRKSEG